MSRQSERNDIINSLALRLSSLWAVYHNTFTIKVRICVHFKFRGGWFDLLGKKAGPLSWLSIHLTRAQNVVTNSFNISFFFLLVGAMTTPGRCAFATDIESDIN